LEIDPNQSSALNYYGLLLKKLGRYDEAIAQTLRLIDLDPTDSAAWSNLGAYHALSGNLEKARESLHRATEVVAGLDEARGKDRGNVWRNLAALQLYVGDKEAVDSIELAIRQNPSDTASWIIQARIRLRFGEGDDLIEALDDVKHADRMALFQDPRAKRVLGMAYLRNSDPRRAAASAALAIKLGDRPAWNRLVAAQACAAFGDLKRARDEFDAARQEWPVPLLNSDYLVTYDEGVLWFDSAEELRQLEEAAEVAISTSNNG
jgi:Tfp pilus assembly protein PilF